MASTQNRPRLFWFSGTGNSLFVARELARLLEAEVPEPVAGTPSGTARDASRIGIVFPVYCFGLPRCVATFLTRVPLNSDAYVFTVATMALLPGAAHRQAERILEARGAALAAGWSLRMPDNFSPVPASFLQRAAGRVEAKTLARLEGIAEHVRQAHRLPAEGSGAPLRGMGDWLHRRMLPRMAHWDRGFRVDASCTGCGLCERICPVGNILLDDGKPVWQGSCEACYACMQWCPVDAVHCRGLLGNRLHYRNPHVRAEELFVRLPGEEDASLRTPDPAAGHPSPDRPMPAR